MRKMVLVFKTNLCSNDESIIVEILSCFNTIVQISFDFEDCDNILRIVSKENISVEIVEILSTSGFYCIELE